MALRLNTSEKNEIMPRRKARAEKPRLAQMLLRSGSLAGVESGRGQSQKATVQVLLFRQEKKSLCSFTSHLIHPFAVELRAQGEHGGCE